MNKITTAEEAVLMGKHHARQSPAVLLDEIRKMRAIPYYAPYVDNSDVVASLAAGCLTTRGLREILGNLALSDSEDQT